MKVHYYRQYTLHILYTKPNGHKDSTVTYKINCITHCTLNNTYHKMQCLRRGIKTKQQIHPQQSAQRTKINEFLNLSCVHDEGSTVNQCLLWINFLILLFEHMFSVKVNVLNMLFHYQKEKKEQMLGHMRMLLFKWIH